jgi:hypothetical protein
MKNYNSFLLESTRQDFAQNYNNNLSIAVDSLLSLVDLSPAKAMPGTEDYEAIKADSERRKFEAKSSIFRKLSNSDNLLKALKLAVFESTKYYNAIKNKLDPARQARAEKKAEEIGKMISMPGIPYKASPVPEQALKREPIARYFLESIIVLKDIAEELKKPGFEELDQQLLTDFKSYFSKAADQKMTEGASLYESKSAVLSSFLSIFPDASYVVDSYRTQISSMLATINSVLVNADTDAPVTKYRGFADKLKSHEDWLSDPNSFSLDNLDEKGRSVKSEKIRKKIDEIGRFVSASTEKDGAYSKFVEESSKPVSLGIGQFSSMLGESSRLLSLGINEMSKLQSIITNIWKASRIFKGFGSEDIEKAIYAVTKNSASSNEEGLKSALKKKIGTKALPKLPKIQSPDTAGLKSADLRRALSPLTDFEKDMEKKAENERAFTISTRIIGNPDGLPNLRPLESRFLKSDKDK